MEKLTEELELKMYFFTIYQLNNMQGGIQSGHAALRYVRKFHDTDPRVWDFIDNHETWIVLNGGTTNDELDEEGFQMGTLNRIADSLHENDIPFSFFHEPDLNNGLTSVCIILDERVFEHKKYPNYFDYYVNQHSIVSNPMFDIVTIKELSNEELIELNEDLYKEWVRLVGGVKNVFLRDLIKGKKLL